MEKCGCCSRWMRHEGQTASEWFFREDRCVLNYLVVSILLSSSNLLRAHFSHFWEMLSKSLLQWLILLEWVVLVFKIDSMLLSLSTSVIWMNRFWDAIRFLELILALLVQFVAQERSYVIILWYLLCTIRIMLTSHKHSREGWNLFLLKIRNIRFSGFVHIVEIFISLRSILDLRPWSLNSIFLFKSTIVHSTEATSGSTFYIWGSLRRNLLFPINFYRLWFV